jgi:hypothetical protein
VIQSDAAVFNDEPFCSNQSCHLHVRNGDAGVTGDGNWALVDGLVFGRGRYDGKMLCDHCGAASVRTNGPAES